MDLRNHSTESRIPLVTKEELKAYRERLGLSQDELAKELRVARNTVSRWELGNSKIPEFLELALRAIEWEKDLIGIVKEVMLEATKDGRWVTEDEVVNRLNQIPNFWTKHRIIEILKSSLQKDAKNN